MRKNNIKILLKKGGGRRERERERMGVEIHSLAVKGTKCGGSSAFRDIAARKVT